MSYTFSWGSLSQNQWIDSTALYSAMQSFLFYSITGSNQPTSSPNFNINSNRFLTKSKINQYVYNPQFTATASSKLSNQYIAKQDLIPQPPTFSVYTGFSSPNAMLYNPNDGLMYVADNDAGNINNASYSNIYSFNPFQLATASYVFGPPGSSTGITLSFYGTVSAGVYLHDYSHCTQADTARGLLYLTGYTPDGGSGGLRIFDINTHELITIPYGSNTLYYRQTISIIGNNIFLQNASDPFTAYVLNRPLSGLSQSLNSQLNGLTSSLKQITYDLDGSNNIVDELTYFTQLNNGYMAALGGKSSSSINLGIYSTSPVINNYTLYTTYPGTTSVAQPAGTKKFVTNVLNITGYDNYARGLYLDSINNRLYISDSGSSCINVIDSSDNDPKNWITLFTIFLNAPNNGASTDVSTPSLTQNLGQYSSSIAYGESNLFINPNNNLLYCSIDFVYSDTNNPRVYKSLHVINRSITYNDLIINPSSFFSDTFPVLNISKFISAGGFNLYGYSSGLTIWNGGVAWKTDGTFIKYGLNITGFK